MKQKKVICSNINFGRLVFRTPLNKPDETNKEPKDETYRNEKKACELCGGRYTLRNKAIHNGTLKHTKSIIQKS